MCSQARWYDCNKPPADTCKNRYCTDCCEAFRTGGLSKLDDRCQGCGPFPEKEPAMTTEDLPVLNKAEVREARTNTGCIIHVVENKVIAAWRPVRPGEWFAVRNPISEEEFQLVAGKEGWELWRDDDGLHNGNIDSKIPESHGLFTPLKDRAISIHGLREIDGCWYARLDIDRSKQVLNPGESIPTPTLTELADATDRIARETIDLGIQYRIDAAERKRSNNLPGLVNAGFDTGLTTAGGAAGQCLNPDAIPTPKDVWAASMISINQAGLAHEARGPVSKFLSEELVKHDNFSITFEDVQFLVDTISGLLYEKTDVRENRIPQLTTDTTVSIITYLHKKKVKPIVILPPPELKDKWEDAGSFDLQASSPLPPEEKA